MNEDGTKSTAVANYYTKEQGARFSSLLGVWELDNNGDENITTYIYTEDLPEDFNLRHCGYQNATPPPSLCEKIFEKQSKKILY